MGGAAGATAAAAGGNQEGWDLWEVAYTDEGHKYYYNRSTGASQWEDPRAEDVDLDTARYRAHPLVPHLHLDTITVPSTSPILRPASSAWGHG